MKAEVNVTLTIVEANVIREFLVHRIDELEDKFTPAELDRSFSYGVLMRLRNELTIF